MIGKLENNPQIISDIFAELFTNIGPHIAKQIPKSLKSFKNYIGSNNLNSFYLNPTTPNEIEKIIKKFKMGKALGPNSIPVNILKANADILAAPISKLINTSFDSGVFPDFCKTAKVIPIFKKGDPLNCTNYRPNFITIYF